MGKADDSVQSLQPTHVMCEFQNMFLNELLRLAPKNKVEFCIGLAFRKIPISKAPYKMTLTEL